MPGKRPARVNIEKEKTIGELMCVRGERAKKRAKKLHVICFITANNVVVVRRDNSARNQAYLPKKRTGKNKHKPMERWEQKEHFRFVHLKVSVIFGYVQQMFISARISYAYHVATATTDSPISNCANKTRMK